MAGEEGPTAEPPPSRALRFPAVARLELDELLDQLVDRASEVRATQGRLRGLLAATRYVSEGLDLDELLRRLVEAGRRLVGARYAALGVIREGRLVQFLHDGMSHEVVAAIGALPEGKGVLGALIEKPEPLRLVDLADHPAAGGFPAGHPPMRSFLGVPIRVGDRVYGNLYLGESERDAFDADDEELTEALASAAGVAIENALLLASARHRERWRAASAELADDLLGSRSLDDALVRLLDVAIEAAPATGAALTRLVPGDPDEVEVDVAVGEVAAWRGHRLPAAGSVTAAALDARCALAIGEPGADPRTAALVLRVPAVGAVVAAPLEEEAATNAAERSVLVLTRSGDAEPFGDGDIVMLEEFARHAAHAFALARHRSDREAVRRLEDREELALQLHEQIVVQVQRVGLALTGTASTAAPGVRDRLLSHVAELDDVVRAVRDGAFPR